MMRMRRVLASLLAVCGVVLLAGCQQTMAVQPRYNPYEPSAFFPDGLSARPVVDNTVARGSLPPDEEGFSTGTIDGQPVTEFPVQLTDELLARGRERFDIYCAPCHGYAGEGNGMVVQRGFPAPQSVHQDRLRQSSPGYFFQVMTAGFGRMPAYNVQLSPADRWAVAAYVRALQLSQSAPAGDLPAEDTQLLGGTSQ